MGSENPRFTLSTLIFSYSRYSSNCINLIKQLNYLRTCTKSQTKIYSYSRLMLKTIFLPRNVHFRRNLVLLRFSLRKTKRSKRKTGWKGSIELKIRGVYSNNGPFWRRWWRLTKICVIWWLHGNATYTSIHNTMMFTNLFTNTKVHPGEKKSLSSIIYNRYSSEIVSNRRWKKERNTQS